jgi:membrane-bound serine protease (ClpP class)
MLVIITLFVLGIFLILLEIFIPGGVLGAVGVVLIIVGVVSTFYQEGAQAGGIATVSVLVAGGIAFVLWLKFFPTSRVGRRIMLDKTADEWRGYDIEKAALVGKRGVAHTDLRPSGMVMIDGKRTDVVTRGEMISRDAEVEVIAVEGNRIVVEVAQSAADPAGSTDAPSAS